MAPRFGSRVDSGIGAFGAAEPVAAGATACPELGGGPVRPGGVVAVFVTCVTRDAASSSATESFDPQPRLAETSSAKQHARDERVGLLLRRGGGGELIARPRVLHKDATARELSDLQASRPPTPIHRSKTRAVQPCESSITGDSPTMSQSFAPIVTDTPLRASEFPTSRGAARVVSPVPLFVSRKLDRALFAALVIALVIHTPALPYASLFRGWLDPTDSTPDGDAIVPLDLDVTEVEVDDKPPPKLEPPKPEPPKPDATSEPPKPEPPKPDATSEPPKPEPPAGLPEPPSTPKDDGTPVGEQEIVKKLSRQPNHVQVVFVSQELRKHPVGVQLGALLGSHPQWEDFFKKNSLDPVRDLDTVVLTGPQFRVSDKVIAILKVDDPPKIAAVVETLVEKGKGHWIDGAPVRAAVTTAEGHERVFALVPEKKLLYMIPSPFPTEKRKAKLADKPEELAKETAKAEATLSEQLKRVKDGSIKDFAESGFAIDAYMVQPWKLIGSKGKEGRVELPLVGEIELLPRSLKRARLRLKVEPGGGATLSLSAESESPEQALKDAEALNSLLPAARAAASVRLKLDLPEFTFNVEKRSLVAKVAVDDAFLERALALGAEAIEKDRAILADRAKKKSKD
jgi:hypothetical protein